MTKAAQSQMRVPGPSSLRSFTLIELLVAIAVLSILVFVLMSMLGSLTNTWAQGQARNERRDVSQAVFDRMSRDLAQVAVPISRTNTNSLNFVISPSWITRPQYPQSMFFQAPVATDGGTNGNMAVVGYFIQWVNGTPGTPTLTRLLINPSDKSNYAMYSSTPNTWITDTLLTNAAPATAPTYTGLLAEHVIGLWVQALDSTGNPITQSFSTLKGESYDSRYPYSYTNYNLNNGVPNANSVTTNAACALPASVQVAIAVVDARTAARITTIPNYPALTGNFWNDVQNFVTNLPSAVYKGTEIQTTIIPIPNASR